MELNAEQQEIVQRLVSSGRFVSAEQAVQAGIGQLADQESEIERIRGLVQEAIDSANRGEIIRGDDFLQERSEARLKRA